MTKLAITQMSCTWDIPANLDKAEALVRVLDHADVHRAVATERAFLNESQSGCHSPLAAMAEVQGGAIVLHVQLFGEHNTLFEETAYGTDPDLLGRSLARRAVAAVEAPPPTEDSESGDLGR